VKESSGKLKGMARRKPYGISAHGEVIDRFETLAKAKEAAEIWISLGVGAEILKIKPAPLKRTRVNAWGEVKSVGEWAKDPRCSISEGTLKSRLKRGKPPEEAIGLPWTPPDGKARPRGYGAKIAIFGESKSIVEWGDDPRCEISPGVFRERLAKGMAPEEALRRNSLAPQGGPPRKLVVIFGETKTISDWARDPRCEVSKAKLWERLSVGKAPEDALRRDCPSRRPVLEAFGEWKTLEAWTRDPRCTVSGRTVRRLVKEGVSLDAALRWRS